MKSYNVGPYKYEPGTKTIRTEKENYWLATVDSWDGMVTENTDSNGKVLAIGADAVIFLKTYLCEGFESKLKMKQEAYRILEKAGVI